MPGSAAGAALGALVGLIFGPSTSKVVGSVLAGLLAVLAAFAPAPGPRSFRPVFLRRTIFALPFLVCPIAAAAAPPDPAALQEAMRAWLAPIAGAIDPALARSLTITEQGGLFRFVLPIPGLATEAGPGALTAIARPQDDGRWRIEAMSLPAQSSFSVRLGEGKDARTGRARMTIAEQDAAGYVDPSLKSGAVLRTATRGIEVNVDAPGQRSVQRMDSSIAEVELRPRSDGRLDFTQSVEVAGYTSENHEDGKPPIAIAAERIRLAGRVDALNPERQAPLAAALVRMANAAAPALEKGAVAQAAMRAGIRDLLAALRDIAEAGHFDESFEGLQVAYGTSRLSVAKAVLGMGGAAADGKLKLWSELVVQEPAMPDLPEAAPFIPRLIVLRPVIAGLPLAELTRIATNATAQDADENRLLAELAGALASGGVSVGMERLEIELGVSKLTGSGQVRLSPPMNPAGEARLTAEGFDALLKSAQAQPELAEAVPILVLARGLARPELDRLVWDIAYTDGKLWVNGIDLDAMAGSGGPAGAPPSPKQ